jgi:hypothetical protein
MESKACSGCAKARRRCGKQKPHCLRCRSRGTSCYYPPAKPSSFVAVVADARKTFYTAPLIFDLVSPPLSSPFVETWWFASPETWTIDPAPPALINNTQRFTTLDLSRLLRKVVVWLAEWVEQGSNPFIHRQLYRHRMPRCIQNAYTSLSSYLSKTATNEHIIYRIIEDRVIELVAEGVPTLGASLQSVDTLEYLGRIQALLVYQCIGLYDGNVRLRHLAEQHIPVLEVWMTNLLQHISQILCCGESLLTPPGDTVSSVSSKTPSENLFWHSWILTESMRRTWLVTAGIQGIYKLIQNSTASCMGGTMLTTRQGFWEAPSAVVWEKRCGETYAGMIRLTEVEKMFALVPKEEICEFAKTVLECTYGIEQVERWGFVV